MACPLYDPAFLVTIRPHYTPSYYPGKLLLMGASHLGELNILGLGWLGREY